MPFPASHQKDYKSLFDSTEIESVSPEQLRAQGSAKWTRVEAEYSASVAETDFGTAPEVRDALTASAVHGPYGYLPDSLSREVSRGFCRLYADVFGHEFDESQVQPVGDVISALETTIENVCPLGTAVIILTPAYMPFRSVPKMLGRQVIEVRMALRDGFWAVDFDGIRNAFRAGARLLILCNPHNPIGKIYSRDELERLAQIADDFGAWVFSDEIHALLTYDQIHIPYASVSEAASRHSVTAFSASKAWNIPGLKCAQVVIPANRVDAFWATARHSASRGASVSGAVATVAAYEHGQEWLEGTRRYLRDNRDLLHSFLVERIPKISTLPPQATYLSWLDCWRLGWGPRPAMEFIKRAGISFTDGYLCGEAGAGHVRLNFATPRPILDKILDRMADVTR